MAVSTIGTSGIADANITTAKLADATVTTAKLAASSALVGKNLIQNGAMTVAQRGVNTILSGFDSTTNSYIADGFTCFWCRLTPQNRADLGVPVWALAGQQVSPISFATM
jgi:hypothetical protein